MRTKLSPNGVAAILFDLDGTLRHNRPSSNQAFFDFAVELGAADAPHKRWQTTRWVHYYWAQSPELLQDMQIYGELNEAFWSFYAYRTLTQFGCPEAQAQDLAPQVHQRMAEAYQPEDHVPEETRQALATLHAAGFPLGVVSNRSRPYAEQMAAWGLEPFFQFALAAGELNSWKPDAGIFLHGVELLGSLPERTIYVGDNYYADILGATNAGLRPVLLDPEGLFPEAECPVISVLGELLEVLKGEAGQNNE
jgi:HAD superfamily hydrolase (TIGR01549 family)